MPSEPFERVSGVIAALPSANIDTDVIMPKTFLKGIDRSGLEKGLFHDLRFDEQGALRQDFVLNQAPWNTSAFLVTGANFGCGSSREHAVWGLRQFGIRAIIARSFAGIFFDNCARNGLLAIEAEEETVRQLTECGERGDKITIDLAAQTLETVRGVAGFGIGERRKYMLLKGLDAVGMTLQWRTEIETFQSRYLGARAWLA
ncbi:3-isopropylmalate dehydratase, small subunit [Hyphomonas neptunium ATCC 15444]|uniref:3-isopropylmalate dehydratase small subunit n=2 Tax=Hyphomonas TaxID=85 RepID=Q0C253_HYPNA|nr:MULTISPECIES: 3-isopropylmalate dehydratase small subunit [Hyphomonas]ABI78403.1 3-isopropylmalate dehydratase, small subunit [Hyphomonas neptunium ATCC 15444]KCZ93098.1 3-isopropylmalate dehydratase small subunit [Hyphomonas hirschiana VP5]